MRGVNARLSTLERLKATTSSRYLVKWADGTELSES